MLIRGIKKLTRQYFWRSAATVTLDEQIHLLHNMMKIMKVEESSLERLITEHRKMLSRKVLRFAHDTFEDDIHGTLDALLEQYARLQANMRKCAETIEELEADRNTPHGV